MFQWNADRIHKGVSMEERDAAQQLTLEAAIAYIVDFAS